MGEQVVALITLVSAAFLPTPQPLLSPIPKIQEASHQELVLAEHQLDLNTRNPNPQINEVFAYNILLEVEYFQEGFTLEPGEVFTFHENVLPEFKSSTLKTGWTKYTAKEGYKTVLGLPGNGVCHLASLINWTASDAGLEVVAKTNHNFYLIPGIPKEYGTSIRYTPDGSLNSQNQNLYVKNSFEFPVKFEFVPKDQFINLTITH